MKIFEKGSVSWWVYADEAIKGSYGDDGAADQLAEDKSTIVGNVLMKLDKKTITNIELFGIMDEIRAGKHDDVATA